jgi:hypothetical protein
VRTGPPTPPPMPGSGGRSVHTAVHGSWHTPLRLIRSGVASPDDLHHGEIAVVAGVQLIDRYWLVLRPGEKPGRFPVCDREVREAPKLDSVTAPEDLPACARAHDGKRDRRAHDLAGPSGSHRTSRELFDLVSGVKGVTVVGRPR